VRPRDLTSFERGAIRKERAKWRKSGDVKVEKLKGAFAKKSFISDTLSPGAEFFFTISTPTSVNSILPVPSI
jgi:hypothetical protein